MTRYLALGDSYTIGEGVDAEEAWPNLLAARLGIAKPQIIARTSWTTDELRAAINAAKPAGPFDVVTLMIGVNNQYRGRSGEEYRGELAALLKRAVELAGGDARRVIVVSIPDWGATPFAEGRDRKRIGREIDQFNEIGRDEARKAGARYVDVTAASRDGASEVAADGLHPSAAMHRHWADRIISEVRDVLGLE